jgi:hypothetical protein
MMVEQVVVVQVVRDAITVNLLVMTAALACYLTSAAHQLGMQAVVVDSVEILQDMHHPRVLEAQHLEAAVAVVQAAEEVADQVEIQEPQAQPTQVVAVVGVVQAQAAMAGQVL